ncbi:hypothetical protein F2Q68_00023366 [Brassica cretica]|uniref:Uncharacterized protein n=1 Tax=Brassica cretica TaxID=69181 RepID=A0A8S9G2V8_BRACR|nr:hypothetical protein F2Q68_00023366 [Brassica cretica]
MSEIGNTINALCEEWNKNPPEIDCCLNDFPNNDFNTTFKFIPSFNKKLIREGCCFVSGVPGVSQKADGISPTLRAMAHLGSREIAMDVGGGPLRSYRRKLLDALKSIVTTAFGLYDHPALSLLISGAGSLHFYFRRLLVVFLVLSKLYTLVMVLSALVSCPVYFSIISINIQR